MTVDGPDKARAVTVRKAGNSTGHRLAVDHDLHAAMASSFCRQGQWCQPRCPSSAESFAIAQVSHAPAPKDVARCRNYVIHEPKRDPSNKRWDRVRLAPQTMVCRLPISGLAASRVLDRSGEKRRGRPTHIRTTCGFTRTPHRIRQHLGAFLARALRGWHLI